MKKTHPAQPNRPGGRRGILQLLAACAAGAAVFTALFCAMAALLCKVDVPQSYLPLMAVLAACTAVFAASMVFARLHGARGLLCGAAFGLGAFLLLWLLSVRSGSTVLTGSAAAKGAVMVLAGALGGFLGVAGAEKSRRPHLG